MIDPVHRDRYATQFTALEIAPGDDPGAHAVPGPVDAARLAALYAYPPGERPWLRVNFVASIDGAVTVDGRSGGLGGPGDRRVFTLLRQLADVIVVGAGTVRAEGYGGARIPAVVQARRVAEGRAAVPRIAVVTASADLDPHHRLFHDTAVPPLVLASPSAEPGRLRALESAGAEVRRLPAGEGAAAIPALLAEAGSPRILCEGGPGLIGRLLVHGAVDELCLTTAPLLVGGDAPRLAEHPLAVQTPMVRRHLLTDETGALYARWAVAAPRGER